MSPCLDIPDKTSVPSKRGACRDEEENQHECRGGVRTCLDFTVYMYFMDFSVYLRLFLAPLPSRLLQIDHYLLHPESANLLKNPSQLNSK